MKLEIFQASNVIQEQKKYLSKVRELESIAESPPEPINIESASSSVLEKKRVLEFLLKERSHPCGMTERYGSKIYLLWKKLISILKSSKQEKALIFSQFTEVIPAPLFLTANFLFSP